MATPPVQGRPGAPAVPEKGPGRRRQAGQNMELRDRRQTEDALRLLVLNAVKALPPGLDQSTPSRAKVRR